MAILNQLAECLLQTFISKASSQFTACTALTMALTVKGSTHVLLVFNMCTLSITQTHKQSFSQQPPVEVHI